MPSSFNGFGTTLYGKRDFRPDGSYVTTEWAIALWIPFFPFSSIRIRVTDQRFGTETYLVVEHVTSSRKQILSVYSYTAAIAAAVLIVPEYIPSSDAGYLFYILYVLLLFLPFLLRRRARKTAMKQLPLNL